MSDTPSELATRLDQRMTFRMEQLTEVLHRRCADPTELRLPVPLWNLLDRIEALMKEPDPWQKILEEELIAVGKAILLGFGSASAGLFCGTPEFAKELAESLIESGALDANDSMELCLWCARQCASDPVR